MVLDLMPVYHNESSGPTAGSCGREFGVGTSHSCIRTFTSARVMAAAKSEASTAVRIRNPERCLSFIFAFVPSKVFNLRMFPICDIVKKEVRPSGGLPEKVANHYITPSAASKLATRGQIIVVIGAVGGLLMKC